jgi:hypothetical protein
MSRSTAEKAVLIRFVDVSVTANLTALVCKNAPAAEITQRAVFWNEVAWREPQAPNVTISISRSSVSSATGTDGLSASFHSIKPFSIGVL